MAVPKFEYFPTRAAFDTARGATTVFNNSVVFIEDTMELFTHGHFWTVSNLSQYYNSSTQKLQLKNGNTVISELDASPFVKDGMLESVELITTPEGSSAVLSVNGTNYPIVELDYSQLRDISYNDNYDTSHECCVFEDFDQTKAYRVINVPSSAAARKAIAFTRQGTFIFTTGNDGSVPLYDSYTSVDFEPNGEWLSFPINNDFHREGMDGDYETPVDTAETFYAIPSDAQSSDATVLASATETTGSASNNNYPSVPYLKFTFNTFDSEPTHTVIRVSIAELFTVYNGDNVLLSSNYAKASTYTEPATGDKVDIAVGKLAKGVADNAAAIATKQAIITGAATTITSDNLTASKALVSDANGKVAASSVTSTELGYLSGVTSSIQTQLNAKANIADLGWVEH